MDQNFISKIYDNVRWKQLKPGLIIVLHDGGKRRDNTVKATEMLINTLEKQGYKFVTVSGITEIAKFIDNKCTTLVTTPQIRNLFPSLIVKMG